MVVIQGLLFEGAKAGEVRRDIPPEELAGVVRRLVALTLAGVRPAR